MDIHFVAQIDASADVVAFPVRKGELAAFVQALGAPHGALLGGTAAQARFEGAAGRAARARGGAWGPGARPVAWR